MAVDFYLTNEDDGRLTSETQTIEALWVIVQLYIYRSTDTNGPPHGTKNVSPPPDLESTGYKVGRTFIFWPKHKFSSPKIMCSSKRRWSNFLRMKKLQVNFVLLLVNFDILRKIVLQIINLISSLFGLHIHV